jgi:hypothetical protein
MTRVYLENSDVSRSTGAPGGERRAGMSWFLWAAQVLLALVFLFTGGTKLVLPVAELTATIPLPGWFVRFIGVAEVLGAFGLILPGLLRLRTILTPLAAAGLVVIMIGAVVCTLKWYPAVEALIPLVVGALTAWVGYARWQLAPLRDRAQNAGRPASPAPA